MKILRHPGVMRAWSLDRRAAGKTIGLVPTMGALHAGHTSLVQASVEDNSVSVVSIFVNPAQFAPHEDYAQYPRAFDADCRILEQLGVDTVYAPRVDTMYPHGYATYVEVERLQDGLCGLSRPHFFRGVATIVTKLFNTVLPDAAYFGEKDGQQAAILRRMTRDLDFGIEIVTLPTVRESDGLAMSSRNQYLSIDERERALAISKGLSLAQGMLEEGERDAQRVVRRVRETMSELDIDYVDLVNAVDLRPVERIEGPVMLAVAARVGVTRLIDNIHFEPPAAEDGAGLERDRSDPVIAVDVK